MFLRMVLGTADGSICTPPFNQEPVDWIVHTPHSTVCMQIYFIGTSHRVIVYVSRLRKCTLFRNITRLILSSTEIILFCK